MTEVWDSELEDEVEEVTVGFGFEDTDGFFKIGFGNLEVEECEVDGGVTPGTFSSLLVLVEEARV